MELNQGSQGTFRVWRNLAGAIEITMPPHVELRIPVAVQIAQAILRECGVQVIFADPGQTVIRPPSHQGFIIDPTVKGNGHG
jgi:hypothetical protein